MASVIDFVNGLMPRQEKMKILDGILNTQEEISTIVLPAYENAMRFNKELGYRSEMFKEFSTRAKTLTGGRAGDNIIVDIHKALQNHQTNLARLAEVIQKDRSKDITIESITYRKANILALIGAIDGFVRYCSRLCGLLWLCEIGEVSERSITRLRQPEYIWIVKHQAEFFASLELGLRDPKEITKTVALAPELLANPETDGSITASLGKQNLIVSKFTVTYSPVLYLRLWWEDYVEWRIKRCQSEKEWLEQCYTAAYTEKTSGTKNAALEQRLKYYGERLELTDRKLKKLEDRPE